MRARYVIAIVAALLVPGLAVSARDVMWAQAGPPVTGGASVTKHWATNDGTIQCDKDPSTGAPDCDLSDAAMVGTKIKNVTLELKTSPGSDRLNLTIDYDYWNVNQNNHQGSTLNNGWKDYSWLLFIMSGDYGVIPNQEIVCPGRTPLGTHTDDEKTAYCTPGIPVLVDRGHCNGYGDHPGWDRYHWEHDLPSNFVETKDVQLSHHPYLGSGVGKC